MSSWFAKYRRWEGQSVGVWERRVSIARYGLRLCLSGKILRIFLALGAFQGLVLAAVFFLFGQVVAPESSLMSRVENLVGKPAMDLFGGIASWALLYPEICVDGVYRIMFFFMSFTAPLLSLVAIALFIHKLITHDLASNAIVIYRSKALTHWDYLIGKFMIVASLLSIIWIFPIVFSWVIGNALAPDWAFFYHTFPSLLRGLVAGTVAVVALSCIALGVSSLAKKTGSAVTFWILGWVGLNFVSSTVGRASPPFANINPFESLYAFFKGLYRIPDWVEDAQGMLPFFGSFAQRFQIPVDRLPIDNGAVILPLAFLTAMCAGSVYLVYRKVGES